MGFNVDTEYKEWSDDTSVRSSIGRLNFSADKYWKDLVIKVKANKGSTYFLLKMQIDGEEKSREFSLKEGKEKQFILPINGNKKISINGYLQNNGSWGVSGSVAVEAHYDSSIKTKVAKWEDRTGGISFIEKMFLTLEKDELWEQCEIRITGHENSNTGCMVNLICNGELIEAAGKYPHWVELQGPEFKSFRFSLNKSGPLVVAGYITRPLTSLVGGGANIELIATYQKVQKNV